MRTSHGAFVESWLKRRVRTASAPALATEALAAVWGRAQRSLSELALQALARCALEGAIKDFPLLADVRVTARGFELGAAADAPAEDLLAALGGLLVELLGLVEKISGEILAPALEAELLRVANGRRTPTGPLRPIEPG
ncbi:MAG: hypothetical protein ABR567_05620 [Myxococcales bacterium]|nr:hypothetical protein [Myxococcales bacterium]